MPIVAQAKRAMSMFQCPSTETGQFGPSPSDESSRIAAAACFCFRMLDTFLSPYQQFDTASYLYSINCWFPLNAFVGLGLGLYFFFSNSFCFLFLFLVLDLAGYPQIFGVHYTFSSRVCRCVASVSWSLLFHSYSQMFDTPIEGDAVRTSPRC